MRKPVLFLLVIVGLSLPRQLHPQDEEPRALFSRAYALYSQGSLSEAESSFVQTLDRGFPLEDYSLYFLGLIQNSRGEWANGRNYLLQLKQNFPQSLWSSQADLQLAKASLGEKDYPRAAGELRAVQGPTIKREIAEQASYLLAQVYELQGDVKKAYSSYQELRKNSPLSRWAAQARREVKKIREQQPESFALNTPEALTAEADLLIREREYDEAEKTYRKLLEAAPEGKQRSRFLMGLANVYRALRKRDEAISILTEIVSRYPDSPEGSDALYRLAVAYWNRDDNTRALEYFDRFKRRYPKSAVIDFPYFASARIYESLARWEDALRSYREFTKRFSDSKWLTEALWREAWIYYLRSDYEQAYASFKRLAGLPAVEGYKNAALYWQGRTAEKLERPDEARQLFLQLLNGKEDTYYKGPAERRLAGLGTPAESTKTTITQSLPEPAPSLQPDFSFHLTRAQELAQISLKQLAVNELDEIQNLAAGDLSLNIILMREYARNQAYSRIVALSSKLGISSEELERYRYPLAYWENIQKVAEENGIDPYLVLALIRQESLFDPKALSPASAYGLMQLLPSTAARTAAQVGLPPPQPERLFEPELNLNLGIHHLRELLQLYSGDLVKAIAAYNAGQNAVARWQRQIVTDDPQEFIERIPYAETRLYVKLVLRNHLNYQRMYGNPR